MFEASEHIRRDYRSRLLALDDDKYYQEIDRVYQTYETPPVQDYRPANQAPGPCQTTQELMQIFGKGRGQARRENSTDIDLSAQEPDRCRVIYSKRSEKQRMRQRYANAQ